MPNAVALQLWDFHRTAPPSAASRLLRGPFELAGFNLGPIDQHRLDLKIAFILSTPAHAVLLEELLDINWDIIELSEVRRTEEGFIELSSGHILCYRGPQEKREHGVSFLIHREIAGNVEEFFSINERVAIIATKLNKRYRLKIVHAYAPTSSYDDEAVDSFYKDVESAMNKEIAWFTIVMGD